MICIPSIRDLGHKRGFKIRGVIGNAGQKGWLSFARRMTEYSEREIIEDALSNDINLATEKSLGTLKDITPARLMRFIQAHFEESNAPDVC